MMELTAWPPSAGRPSTSATLRPRRAASSAAETPAMPAPSTQISAPTPARGARARWPAHDAGRGRDLGLVRVHRWSGRCHPTHHTDYSSGRSSLRLTQSRCSGFAGLGRCGRTRSRPGLPRRAKTSTETCPHGGSPRSTLEAPSRRSRSTTRRGTPAGAGSRKRISFAADRTRGRATLRQREGRRAGPSLR